ncbi:hypothetical protein [Pseudomonas entomophila]|uniref:hypothetical protein n=1 Tax=Pseudomonas entomophila TaxID=312306 RepID=UPI00201097E9|nr:hypothetical protein [Pseudomonas entomophila]
MINYGTKVETLDSTNISLEMGEALSALSKWTKNEIGVNFRYDPESKSAQARSRFALQGIEIHRSLYDFTHEEMHIMYKLCIKKASERTEISGLYRKLMGFSPKIFEDALGLRVPFRAMFVLLWIKGKATLPYTFTTEGVFHKYPILTEESKGFIYNLATTAPQTIKPSRVFQYRTNWHSPEEVSFEEVWDAAPFISKSTDHDNNDFRYQAWLNAFSSRHPERITQEQVFYLEKYQQFLSADKSTLNFPGKQTQTYNEFKEYYNCTPHQAKGLSRVERQRQRRNISQEKKAVKKDLNIKAKYKEAIDSFIQSGDDYSPAELALVLRKIPKSLKDFSWLNNSHYYTREHVDLNKVSSTWIAASKMFLEHIKKNGDSTSTKKTKIKNINFLFDYLFCYLPIWFECNPDSLIRLPTSICEFERVLFWNNHISEDDKKSYLFKSAGIPGDISLPITACQFYDQAYSKKTKSSFVLHIFEFFEFCRANRVLLNQVTGSSMDAEFANPVNLIIDRTGSGSRGSSNKVPLPLDSTLIAKSYIQAINDIGVNIRTKILNNEISESLIEKIKSQEWITLSDLGLDYTIKIQSSIDDSLDIPLTRIVNVYSWYLGRYSNISNPISVPWMTVVRMLSIALYTGLRMQNCQWLDINTFDQFVQGSNYPILSSCMIFVNTDKNGKERPAVISSDVMNSLLDEKEFQTNIFTRPVTPTFYEGDQDDPQEYGPIYPLFRSPWVSYSQPFSDNSYTLVWPKILKGIEEVYNSLVPQDRHHTFVKTGVDGKLMAIHTPHALRATWITHMKIYGHLEVSIIQGQVAHENEYTTNYYVVPNAKELMEQIDIANAKVASSAWSRLKGIKQANSHPQSVIPREWAHNRVALAKDQSFISISSAIIETEASGIELIATTANEPVAFFTQCVCVKNGECPKQLIAFTGRERVCGLCPIAVFGVDHLPGINCIMRRLAGRSEQLIQQLKKLKASDASPEEIEYVHHDLTINKLELASYLHISQLLNKHLETAKNEVGLITRLRDIKEYVKHDINMSNPAQRVIAQILDSSLFPQLTGDGYPHLIQKIAKSPDLLQVALSDPDAREMYTAQILTIMTTMGISLSELSDSIESRHIKLLEAAA